MSSEKNSAKSVDLEIKKLYLKVNELSFRDDSLVVDLIRFLQEKLSGIQILRDGNELEITAPASMAKKTIKLRIRKFLYKNHLKDEYRPISYIDDDKDGFEIKERKKVEFTYY